MILCTARNCVSKLLGELLGETMCQCTVHDGLLLWSITMHSFFISLWWEWETENERQDQIDKCCAFRIVVPQFSAKPLRMLGVPWLFRLVEGRDSITPSITSHDIMLFPQKTHQSMSCYHLFSILKKHNYFGLSYVIIYFPCNTAYSLGYSHTMLYHVVPHFQTTAVFFVTEIDIIWGWSTGVVLWLGPRMPWNDTSQLADLWNVETRLIVCLAEVGRRSTS